MAATKVLVKITTNSKLCTKKNLLIICDKHKVKIVKVINSGVNLSVFCLSIDDTEKLFSEPVASSLFDCGFSAVLPGELKSNRSVLIKSMDPSIFDHTTDDIKNEIVKCNSWCEVAELIKLTSTIKVVFSSSAMAVKSIDAGLSMFYLHVPGRNIVKDRFVKLTTCFSCYAVEDHLADSCPKRAADPSFKVCSRCSETGHDFKACPGDQDIYRCVNCTGGHHAMAMVCPYRKNALRKKRSSQDLRKTSDVVKSSMVSRPPLQPLVDAEVVYKSMSLIFLASLKNVDSPGSFSDELNSLYTKNNIPLLDLSDFVPPSHSALRDLCRDVAVTVDADTPVDPPSDLDKSRSDENIVDTPEIISTTSTRSGLLTDVARGGCIKPKGQTDQVVGSPASPAVWDGYHVYKIWGGTKFETTEGLMRAWEAGEAMITTTKGNVPDFNTVVNLISAGVLPTVSTLKKDAFKNLMNSPSRFIKSKKLVR